MMLLAETAAEARSSNSLSPAVCRASLKQQHRVFVPSSLSLFAAFHCQKVLSSSCPSYDREKELKAYCYKESRVERWAKIKDFWGKQKLLSGVDAVDSCKTRKLIFGPVRIKCPQNQIKGLKVVV